MSKRLIIIGLDGVPYHLIKDLSARGIMPNIRNLIERHRFNQIRSTLPEISSVAWSSIITGKDPAAHGVFGFTDIEPLSYRVFFTNYCNLKESPFWKERKDLYYQIINVPATYPVQPLNGILVSGFVSYEMNSSVYPRDLLGYLKDIDYRIDVDSEKAHSSIDAFIDDMDRTLDAREKFFNYTWDSRREVFMFVFTETDRLFHFLWQAYEDKGHRYHGYFLDFFRRIDTIIGKKIQGIREGDALIILSDHGFEKMEREVYVNNFLKDNGVLQKDCYCENMELKIDASTEAFSLDPARIYVNCKDRFPRGGIEIGKKDKIMARLRELFSSWNIEGAKVISKIFSGEEIYEGLFKKFSPDLVLVPNKGFSLRSSFGVNGIYSDGLPFTGKHTHEGAFMVTNFEIDAQSNFSVIDAGKIIIKQTKSL